MQILLVEDNPDHAFITRRALLDAHGDWVKLEIAEDGERALDYLFRRGSYATAARPDLVLLDLQLPATSGFEVLRQVKDDPDLRRIPVIVLTTSEAEKDTVRSYDLYANEYVSKPVSASEYMDKIRSIPEYWMKVSRIPPADRQPRSS